MNERDLQILAQADAREVMDQGLEQAQARLTELESREVTEREAAVKGYLEDFLRKSKRNQTLESLGVGREVYESQGFAEFSDKFRPEVPVEEVYGFYAAAHPEQSLRTLGSMRTSAAQSAVKDFYSFEEARQFSRRDLDRNPALFRAVMDSMAKWK